MRIVRSFVAGLEKVVQFPSLIAWLYLTSVLLTVPLALSMRTLLKDSLGSSLVHENLRQGFDMDWYGEFSSGSAGLADSFGPSVVGSLPILSNLEKLIDGEILQADGTILLAGLLFLLAWAFFAGGILDRYAHPDEPPTRARFFSQNGEYFFRFVRLLIISLLFYWGIFRWVANPLHDWLEDATRDVTQEKTVILFTLMVYALVAFLLLLVSMVLDYAKIALVVERRRSALLACLRGARFVLAHPGSALGLYLLLAAVSLLLVWLYSLVAPGPGQSGATTILLAFLVGQIYLIARLGLKLWFLAGQTALFQSADRHR
ncbi:MAG: hypothetical protein IH916_03420 [Acidobacteria bacterium]|nr:hypothetical protein [Acidobacteriota bacterium]